MSHNLSRIDEALNWYVRYHCSLCLIMTNLRQRAICFRKSSPYWRACRLSKITRQQVRRRSTMNISRDHSVLVLDRTLECAHFQLKGEMLCYWWILSELFYRHGAESFGGTHSTGCLPVCWPEDGPLSQRVEKLYQRNNTGPDGRHYKSIQQEKKPPSTWCLMIIRPYLILYPKIYVWIRRSS